MGIYISIYKKGKTFGNGRVSFKDVTAQMPFNPLHRKGHCDFAINVYKNGQCAEIDHSARIGYDVYRPTNFDAIRANLDAEFPKLSDLLDVVEKDESLYFGLDLDNSGLFAN